MVEILLAVAVLGIPGLLLAGILVLASHFMKVEEDETTVALRACLPGANCGACGYAGCDEYAKALALGGVKANLCIPGSVDVAEKLSHILGVEVEAPLDLVAVLACNGVCGATEAKYVYDGVDTCQCASLLYAGPSNCTYGCIGCGDCAKGCPQKAIHIEDGIAHIDSSLCIGCGICAKACPKGLIHLVEQHVTTIIACDNHDKGAVARKNCSNACIACKKCEKVCPHGAITVVDNLASIDYTKCTGCGICVENCPVHCLKTVNLYCPH
jgi:Na+-translocating ferredoxin:NAD+ oxidoreductase RNF subunit RnfB